MEVARRGKNIHIGSDIFRFPTAHQTAQAAFELRQIKEDSAAQIITVTKKFKGKKQ